MNLMFLHELGRWRQGEWPNEMFDFWRARGALQDVFFLLGGGTPTEDKQHDHDEASAYTIQNFKAFVAFILMSRVIIFQVTFSVFSYIFTNIFTFL